LQPWNAALERNLERFANVARRALGAETVRTIVEVGARDCRETLGFHALFPQAAIFAFECNPATLPQCRGAVRGLANVTLVEQAVSDKSGPASFFAIDQQQTKTGIAGGNPGASSLLRASGNYELETYVQREVAVTATTLAEFMAERKLTGIDLLWMDIQGAELMALKGLGSRLEDVSMIHLETEFIEIYRGQPLFPELRDFLQSRGFSFMGFTVYSRHSADAVFANAARVTWLRRLAAQRANPYLLGKRATYFRHRVKRRLLSR
jgi:FkbM family methyltransferase